MLVSSLSIASPEPQVCVDGLAAAQRETTTPAYLLGAKAAQDEDKDTAGGLSLIPGSHLSPLLLRSLTYPQPRRQPQAATQDQPHRQQDISSVGSRPGYSSAPAELGIWARSQIFRRDEVTPVAFERSIFGDATLQPYPESSGNGSNNSKINSPDCDAQSGMSRTLSLPRRLDRGLSTLAVAGNMQDSSMGLPCQEFLRLEVGNQNRLEPATGYVSCYSVRAQHRHSHQYGVNQPPNDAYRGYSPTPPSGYLCKLW